MNFMKFDRRHFLHLAGAAAFTAVPALACSPIRGRSRLLALAWPSRPVRLAVRSASGQAGNVVAGLVGEWLAERLGQRFIVEPRTGAATNITTEGPRCASPDGYALLVASTADAIDAKPDDSTNCIFIHDTPVAGLIKTPLAMVVGPSFPADTIPSFLAYAKANPGKIRMATYGHWSPPHVAGELFKTMASVDVADVAYRDDVPAITDLLAGQVQVYFGALPATIEFIRAGNLRALAVTGSTRSDKLPDVPAMAEFLPGYEAAAWIGLNALGNTPPEIVEKLNREVNAALADTNFKEQLARLGAMPLPGSPSDYARLIADDIDKMAKAMKASGATAD